MLNLIKRVLLTSLCCLPSILAQAQAQELEQKQAQVQVEEGDVPRVYTCVAREWDNDEFGAEYKKELRGPLHNKRLTYSVSTMKAFAEIREGRLKRMWIEDRRNGLATRKVHADEVSIAETSQGTVSMTDESGLKLEWTCTFFY